MLRRQATKDKGIEYTNRYPEYNIQKKQVQKFFFQEAK